MNSRQDPSSTKMKQQVSRQSDQGPQGIERKALQQNQRSQQFRKINEHEQKRSSPTTIENQTPLTASNSRKRHRGIGNSANHTSIGRPRKRLRSFSAHPYLGQTIGQDATSDISISQKSYISHWAEEKTWPKEYFEHDTMHHLFARQKSSASLRRKRSDASLVTSVTPSDQRSREEKSAPYRNATYPTLLETLGHSYMDESELGITDESKILCQHLLEKKYPTPNDTLFRDDVFPAACRNLRDKNEARIILDIARLLVPSPEALVAFGSKNLSILVESVNEGWNNCIPITNPRPQPDFSVGFGRSIFSDDQLSKLQPFFGDLLSLSYFRATYYMYFPFLTSEVKCGTTGLDIADRQNSHSNTLAVRGYVELFRLAQREGELHRKIITFSISHDQRTVRLYGYYPVIEGPKTRIYRHQIDTFDITARNGKEKWTAYNFAVSVYEYSLTLHKSICSVVDGLPSDFNLMIPQPSEPQLSEHSGLSQQLGDQNLAEVYESQSSRVDLQQITPDQSTQAEKPVPKKKRGNV